MPDQQTGRNDAHFHWQEGMKFAHEGIKSVMLLNGVSTVSVLTFIGNTYDGDDKLVYAMMCFALGSFFGPVSFLFAYLSQLQYGNGTFTSAAKFHWGTYFCIVFGLILFLAGVVLAGKSFTQLGQSFIYLEG